jgi:CHAT domain-containing protein
VQALPLVLRLLASGWIAASGAAHAAAPAPGPTSCPAPTRAVAATAPLPPLFAAANAARAAAEAGRSEGLADELARLEVAAEGEAPATRTRLWIHLARTHLLRAEAEPAARARQLPQAAALLGRAAETAAGHGELRLESYALGYLGEIHEAEGRAEDALELTHRALLAAQHADAPDAIYRWQWQRGRIQRAAGRSGPALADFRAAVAALARIRRETAVEDVAENLSFRRQVEPIYFGLVDLLLSAASDADAEREALLAEARRSLESLKAAELRDYFADPCLDAQRRAAPEEIAGAVVVYPVVLPDRLELIVSVAGRLEHYAVAVDRERFVAEIRAFRQKLEKRTSRQYLRHSWKLYDWMIRPLEPLLAAADVDTIVFVPGGALRTIPLGALHDRETNQFLIEKYPVAITPGLTLTEPRPIDRGRVQVLAAGITESVQGYPPLEAVGLEIAAVAGAFPGRQLVDAEFLTERFESAVAARPFGIVHIASHGEISADSSESFLLTWDGRYSMDQLANLVGTMRFRDDQPLELLALSACQTAAGDDRAALGLAGVALRSGARSALATLWSVDDRASAALVTEFYAQLGNPEVSRARALQRAQLKLIHLHHYRHPGYWSPFLLISSWL